MKNNFLLRISSFIVFAIFFTAFNSAYAQVTIGAGSPPDEQAVLDLQSSGKLGLLMPRVQLTAADDPAPFTATLTPGMSVYHTGPVSGGNTLAAGTYTWDGVQWISGGSSDEPWFYMPSIEFNVTPEAVEAGETNVNLYNKYIEQFNTVAGGKAVVKSTSAPELPAEITIPAQDELYYYIIGYDKDVFNIKSLDDAGNLLYEVKQVGSEKTFINIVFVRK